MIWSQDDSEKDVGHKAESEERTELCRNMDLMSDFLEKKIRKARKEKNELWYHLRAVYLKSACY
jgi:hypothetical protein